MYNFTISIYYHVCCNAHMIYMYTYFVLTSIHLICSCFVHVQQLASPRIAGAGHPCYDRSLFYSVTIDQKLLSQSLKNLADKFLEPKSQRSYYPEKLVPPPPPRTPQIWQKLYFFFHILDLNLKSNIIRLLPYFTCTWIWVRGYLESKAR